MKSSAAKSRVLVTELWGLGDLALAIPFLQIASHQADVTLLAKPETAALVKRFAPAVSLEPLIAPWTAFTGKYRLLRWPWGDLEQTRKHLVAGGFELGFSARPDPRDHLLLAVAGVRRRFGFLRPNHLAATVSRAILTDPLPAPANPHRAEYWRALGNAVGWPIPPQAVPTAGHESLCLPRGSRIVIHSGAGRPTKIWPLDRFCAVVRRLRGNGYSVQVLCDANQLEWWQSQSIECSAPIGVAELLAALEGASAFVGNDSGPGHVAALLGVPPFTLFGNQFPAAFAPVHPRAAWIEGSPCPYKPCYDACRFPVPNCLYDISTELMWSRLSAWLDG
jgi:ADP-heptose:LPS heptosyltransferase